MDGQRGMTGSGLLESRAAIEDLVHRYALNVRDRKGDDCHALFTDDATFEVREIEPADPTAQAQTRNLLRGKDAIRDYVGRSSKSNMRICPMIHNLLIEMEGDSARSSCIMTTRTWPAGQEMIGQYDDTYHYEDGQWRFRSRTYTIFLSHVA